MSEKPLVSPLLLKWLYGVLAGLLLYKTAQFAGFFLGEGERPFVDINAFHVAGEMAWAGKMDQAYTAARFLEAQRAIGPSDVFMPWAYPPPFDLVAALLALLPVPLAYLAFAGGTLALYLVVLKRIAGEDLPLVLAATFPAIFITLACGQNGFMTGALVGLACLWMLSGDRRAGVPLGLMVIKPHLAVPFALHAVMTRDWRVVFVAALTAMAACVLATIVLGTSIWPAFLHGTAEAKVFLTEGMYRLYRMVSAYALVRSLGAPAPAALAAQALVAVAVLGMVVIAIRRSFTMRQCLGIASLASPFVSPYAYDYDLALYGVGLALLVPDLKSAMSEREQMALVGLGIVGGGVSLLQQHRMEDIRALGSDADLASLGALPLLVSVALIWRVLTRAETPTVARAIPANV